MISNRYHFYRFPGIELHTKTKIRSNLHIYKSVIVFRFYCVLCFSLAQFLTIERVPVTDKDKYTRTTFKHINWVFDWYHQLSDMRKKYDVCKQKWIVALMVRWGEPTVHILKSVQLVDGWQRFAHSNFDSILCDEQYEFRISQKTCASLWCAYIFIFELKTTRTGFNSFIS